MKKISILLCAVIFVNLFSAITFASNNINNQQIINTFLEQNTGTFSEQESTNEKTHEQKIHCAATIEDDFTTADMIVVLTKEQSALQQEYNKKDFKLIEVKDVHVLFDYYPEKGNNMILSLEVNTKSKQDILDIITVLENDERILSAEPDYVFQSAESEEENTEAALYITQSGDSVTNERLADIYTYSCCARKYTDTSKNNVVKVGIIDGGIHNTIAGISSKVAKYIHFSQYGTQEVYTDPGEDYHGTNCASVLTKPDEATVELCPECDNNIYSGVCNNVELYSLNVFNNSVATLTDITSAINYANNNNIKILNVSIDSSSSTSNDVNTLEVAISAYGGVVIVAAGNKSLDLETGTYDFYPTKCISDNVIVVGSDYYDNVNEVFRLDYESNYGQNTVDLMATGECVVYMSDTEREKVSGTSFAAPRVAGAAAVLLNICPNLTPAQLRHYILAGVDASPDLAGKCVTGGSLNVYKSAKILISDLAVQWDTIFAGHFTRTDKMQVAAYCQVDAIQMKCYVWTYDTATGKFSDPEHWFTNSSYALRYDPYNANNMYRSVAGDFDGNGYTEICTLYDYQDYLFIEGNGYSVHPVNYLIGASVRNFTGRVVAGDFDGDGKDEIAALYKEPSDWAWTKLYRWDFSGVGTGLVATQSILYDSGAGNYEASFTTDRVVAGDFDGDEYDEVAVLYSYPDGVYSLHKFDLYMYSAEYSSLIYRNSNVDVLKMTGRLVACNYNGGGDDEIVGMFDNSAAVSAGIINYGFRFWSYNNAWSATPLYTSSANAYFAARSTNLVVSADFTGDALDDIVTMYYLYDANGIPGRGKINICRNVANLDYYGEIGYKSVWDPLM